MNTMLFYDPKTKKSIRVKACQTKAGIWFAGRPSPAKVKSWATRNGMIHVTSRTKLSDVLGAVA